MTRFTVLAATLALLLLAAGCSGGTTAERQHQSTSRAPEAGSTATGSAPNRRQLTDLHDITELRSLFNTRSGEPRLILLVSPT